MPWSSEIVNMDDVAVGKGVVDVGVRKEVYNQHDLTQTLQTGGCKTSYLYTTQPREWPPLLEAVDSWELPSEFIARYNASSGGVTASCGIFPEICKAWASVDNSFFLFDKRNGHCPEYYEAEQVICAVGLAKTRPQIFVDAIQYVLVLTTHATLMLVGVRCAGSRDGSDQYVEVSLQQLPDYSIPSDGVTMTCITSTNRGQIFLAGRDGCIYELQYSARSGGQEQCRKVCLTSDLRSAISRWVFKLGAVDPIVEMTIDNERHILYALTEDMKIQVFSLGKNGDGLVKKVAEKGNLLNQRDRQSAAKTTIVSISPLSAIESRLLHLVAVLSDGRRLYLSTFGYDYHNPNCLKVVTTRPAPPLGVCSVLPSRGVYLAGRSQSEDRSLEIESAYCSAGTLVLSELSTSGDSSLVIVNKDSRLHQSLREMVSSLSIEGRMLFVADVPLLPATAAAVQSLYSPLKICGRECEKTSNKLWARGDLSTQLILPRRRVFIFSTVGITEAVFNRPVDILKRLLETNSRPSLQDFFSHFGSEESAAMCLMVAARIVDSETLVSNVGIERAVEAYEDPRLVGVPHLGAAFPNSRLPVFSDAHKGLCLCTSRLLLPLWELPVFITEESTALSDVSNNLIIVCRLPGEAMQILEDKIRSLEEFLRSRRNQTRGLYGYVAGQGDLTGSILVGAGMNLGADDRRMVRNRFRSHARNVVSNDGTNRSQQLHCISAEVAAMEVRKMECIRQLLLRCGEALFLLQLLLQHDMRHLIHNFDDNIKEGVVKLTFRQLVCSEEGDKFATRLVSALIEHYIGPDGMGVDNISGRLQEGCPSYYKESDYKFYLAVECLERAAATLDTEERENLARKAFNYLSEVPESIDLRTLRTVCKHFEDLRFYEALVLLPLQKAQVLDPARTLDHALAERQCYQIIASALSSLTGESTRSEFESPISHVTQSTLDQASLKRCIRQLIQDGMKSPNKVFRRHLHEYLISLGLEDELLEFGGRALHHLKGEGTRREFGSSIRHFAQSSLDEASRKKYIRQIVQHGMQYSDKAFHHYLYQTLIHLGLEDELLEYGGLDLVSFLQNAGREPVNEVCAVSAVASPISPLADAQVSTPSTQAKYFELLARYYVSKRQHILASHVLVGLAERRSTGAAEDAPTLEQRQLYLSDAVAQARRGCDTDDGVVLLQGKLAVLKFQRKIKDELEAMTSRLEVSTEHVSEKAKELSMELKSITQLYNDYAVPSELWEICLEMLYFASYSDDGGLERQIWARLIDQALTRGGIAEVCIVLKRVGSHVYPEDGAVFTLHNLCLHLEKAALDRVGSGVESVGDKIFQGLF